MLMKDGQIDSLPLIIIERLGERRRSSQEMLCLGFSEGVERRWSVMAGDHAKLEISLKVLCRALLKPSKKHHKAEAPSLPNPH